MLSAADSRILGDKNNVSDSDDSDSGEVTAPPTSQIPQAPQTGPKGVLADFKRFSDLQKLQQQESERQRMEDIKKHAFTADPNKHAEDAQVDDEGFEKDDEFLKKYHEKRLKQLQASKKATVSVKHESRLHDFTGDQLLSDVEAADSNTILVVHIYDSGVRACTHMNKCLTQLASHYPYVKFARVSAADAGVSLNFKMNALPTLQVYKGGKLIGNFLRMQEHLDAEFYPSDVENFLIDSRMLDGFSGLCNDTIESDED